MVKISSALKYRAALVGKLLQARPGCLGHLREGRKRGGGKDRGTKRRISGRMRLARLRIDKQTAQQIDRGWRDR